MIHVYCDGGLGNRLLTVFSALYFAKKAKKPFIIHWPSNNWCGCNFTDIISNDYKISNFDIQFIDDHVLDKCLLLIHEPQINHRRENKIILNGSLSQDEIIKIMSDTPNVFYYGNQLHRSLNSDIVIEIINELTVSDQVLAKISKYNVSDRCGIHIRKTDYGKKPYIDENQLENEVIRNRDKKYFLCSDEKEVEVKFKKYDNVLSFEKTNYVEKLRTEDGWNGCIVDNVGRSFTFNVNRPKAASIDAFCDMILLSRTATRLHTSGSSFLACADLISKTELAK
jgi:hypothetical protein